MQFGLQASRVSTLQELRSTLSWAEQSGFEAVYWPDHLMGTPLAVGPTLATAAQLSSRLRLGSLVYANDFRHPLLLARELATLQLLSGGRMVCGLGTGWQEAEYRATGLTLDPPGLRLSRLEEAVTLLKQAWSGETFSFSGEHYQVSEFVCSPRVAPPLLMLGGGGRRLLALAARQADGVNFNARLGPEFDLYTDQRLAEQVEWVREQAGERFRQLKLSLPVYYGAVGPDTRAAQEVAALGRGFSPEQAACSPLFFFGSLGQVRERLEELAERYGIGQVIFSQYGCDLESLATVVSG
ncbi:TIGR03621 family F420-dependent LLM class oxidoreductase [bacterium CPR1]|nr:TIGR03621 family F420-dependent LLM class oxidoreductase [bacterium CPR1]